MAEGFMAPNWYVPMLYFRIRRRYKIDGEAECLALMRELTRRHRLKYLPHPEKELQGKTAWRIQ